MGGGGGGGGCHALVPWSGVKNNLGASAIQFPPTWEKQWILLGMECPPTGAFPVGGSRLWGM